MSNQKQNNEFESTIGIKTLDDLKKFNFIIPIYQRKYAWSETEIEQLIKDLKEFENKNNENKYFNPNC